MKAGTIVKPNLLVIGVQKGGTTWLHRCLASHPSVYMSKTKELHFFQKTADEVRDERALAHSWWACNADAMTAVGRQSLAKVPQQICELPLAILARVLCQIERA